MKLFSKCEKEYQAFDSLSVKSAQMGNLLIEARACNTKCPFNMGTSPMMKRTPQCAFIATSLMLHVVKKNHMIALFKVAKMRDEIISI